MKNNKPLTFDGMFTLKVSDSDRANIIFLKNKYKPLKIGAIIRKLISDEVINLKQKEFFE